MIVLSPSEGGQPTIKEVRKIKSLFVGNAAYLEYGKLLTIESRPNESNKNYVVKFIAAPTKLNFLSDWVSISDPFAA